jgi:hypothetical protein
LSNLLPVEEYLRALYPDDKVSVIQVQTVFNGFTPVGHFFIYNLRLRSMEPTTGAIRCGYIGCQKYDLRWIRRWSDLRCRRQRTSFGR